MLQPLLALLLLNAPAQASAVPGEARIVGFLPRAVTSFGAEIAGDYAYVLGGYFGTPHEYSREGQSEDFYRISLRDFRDVDLLPSPGRAQSLALVEHGGELVRVGGMVIHNAAGEEQVLRSIDRVQRFAPLTRTWTELPPLPAPRSSHDAAVWNGWLFVAGGWRLSEDGRSWHDTLEVLDLDRPEDGWSRVAAPFRARALALAATSHHVWAMGGITPGGEISSNVHRYDPEAGTWEAMPDYPGEAFAVSTVAVGDRLFASGRDGVIHTLDADDAHPSWTAAASWTLPRFFHQLVASPERIYQLGGIADMSTADRLRPIEALDLVPSPAMARQDGVLEIPFPGRATKRQALFLDGTRLYAFGGNTSVEEHAFDATQFTDEGWVLDLGSLRWAPTDPFPRTAQSMAASLASDGPVALVLGGFAPDADGDVRSLETSYLYEADVDWWRPGPPLPQGRTQCGVVRRGDEVYVFGGLAYDPDAERGESFGFPTDVLRLRDGQAAFEVLPTEGALSRRDFACALLDDRVYLVGGTAEGYAHVHQPQVFDLESLTWSNLPAPSETRFGARLVPVGERLALVGGAYRDEHGEKRGARWIEIFDPAQGTWSVAPEEIPLDPMELAAFPYGERLLLYSAQRAGTTQLAFVDLARP